ncbi:unnamed protein product [Hermetia illucens]|uniref:Neurogenic protein mastermind n=1 Tax=Hermetia illucens TaxID=343691 RepID=A0A7R8YXV6_HERIL|nr:unnamed protein product [Hermetia illucens]
MSYWKQNFLKRPADDVDTSGAGGPENFEPPLEFTTSAANSQPQQISTNVTVKALTNTSVKSEGGGGAGGGGGVGQNVNPGSGPGGGGAGGVNGQDNGSNAGVGDLQNQLDKDGSGNGQFPGLSDLVGDNTNEEGDALIKDLISNLPEFHSEFLDFEEKPLIDIKTEDGIKSENNAQSLIDSLNVKSEGPLGQFNPNAFGNDNQGGINKMRNQYQNGPNAPMSELSPAAQTLKHMAEQHQHKNAMGMNFPRPPMQSHAPPQNQMMGGNRFGDFNPFANDFMGTNTNQTNPSAAMQQPHSQSQPQVPPSQFHKTQQSQSYVDIKQELFYSSQNDFDLKRLQQQQQQAQMQQQQQQQQQQQNSIGPGGMPPNSKMGPMPPGAGFNKPSNPQTQSQQQNAQQQQYSPYGSPMSGGPNNSGSPGAGYMPTRGGNGPAGTNPNVGPGGGGHMPPGGNNGPGQMPQQGVPPNAQQRQQSAGGPNSATGPPGGNGVPNAGSASATTLQMKQTQQLHISQQAGAHGIQVSAGQHLHLSGDLKSNVSVAAQQGVFFSHQQQQHQQQQQQQQQAQQHHQQQNSNNLSNNQQCSQNQSVNNSQGSSNESYSMSQSQSINFNQQTIRQRQSHVAAAAANSVGMGGGAVSGGPNLGGQSGLNPNGPGSTNAMGQPTNVPPGLNPQAMNQMSAGGNPQMVGQTSGMPGQGMPGGPGNPMRMSQAALSQSMNQMSHGPESMMGMGGMNPGNMSGMPNQMSGMGGMVPNAMGGNGMGSNSMLMGAGGPMNMNQAKFMQQQQMLRAQALQQQQQQHMGGSRPPPPEYKATQAQLMQAQMMHQSSGGRFPNAAQAAAMRRMSQQPIPPSGPMMRPQHSMFMQHSAAGHVGGPRNALGAGVPFGASGPMGGPQRPPNVQVNPEGMPIGSQQEWRHIMMSQQQNMSFNSQGGGGPQMRQNAFNAGAHQGGFMSSANAGGNNPGAGMGVSGMQMTPAQMQQQMLRSQQQNQMSQQNPQNMLVGPGMGPSAQHQQQQSAIQQMLHQQQDSHNQQQHQQQGMMTQMQMASMHMSQTQQITLQQQQQQQFVQHSQQTTTNQQHSMIQSMAQAQGGGGAGNANSGNVNNQQITSSASTSVASINQTINSVVSNTNDFGLDFLENSGDVGNLSAQDLLNSLDSENFNIF